MLSKSELRRYSRMSPEQRYLIFLELANWAWESLASSGPQTSARKWALIRKQHELASQRLVEKFKELP